MEVGIVCVADSTGIFDHGPGLVGNATDAIESIIVEVYSRINRFPFTVWDELKIDESRVQEVISAVNVGFNEEVKMVGICGGRGISRMARVVCNSIARHFDDLWYFDGVLEIARGYDSTCDDFKNLIIKPWFPKRKILVILDDVKELDLLRSVRECDRFGEGSMIIVATRVKQLLVSHGIEIIYDVERNSALDEKEKDPNDQVLPFRWTYDVFLSYGGDDTCLSFVSRLYNSLCERRIRAFVNDELVKTSGEELKAIKESRTAIIVISEKYASSPSCLDSLATILECFRMECRFIYAIFYYFRPLERRHQTVSLGRVFERLAFKHNKEQVQKWASALKAADDSRLLSFLHRRRTRLVRHATEDELAIEQIVEDVYSSIDIFPFAIWDGLKIDESSLQEVISAVDVGSNEGVKMVGIRGGIGISGVACALCNSIARHFEDLWYFDGVDEIARGYYLTCDDFKNLIIKPWFPKKKILVILDNVKELDLLRVVRGCDRFGEGSRIVVVMSTGLLVNHGIEIIYDVEWNFALDEKEKDPNDQSMSVSFRHVTRRERKRGKTLTALRHIEGRPRAILCSKIGLITNHGNKQ